MPVDIIVLAAVAAFIVYKLRSILGQTDEMTRGGERNRDDAVNPLTARKREDREAASNVIPIIQAEDAEEVKGSEDKAAQALGTVAQTNLKKIQRYDSAFTLDEFLGGAAIAFEMVIEAFNKGDLKTLKMLLADDVYKDFEQSVKAREGANEREETTLVSIVSTEVGDISIHGKDAEIEVAFVSRQINIIRDIEGKIIEGNPSHIDEIEDEWVFARKVDSKDPNWRVIAT